MVRVSEVVRCDSAHGAGPVDALNRGLRQCLLTLYPAISMMQLTGYDVQALQRPPATGPRVCVSLEWPRQKAVAEPRECPRI